MPLGEIARKDNRQYFWNLENAPELPRFAGCRPHDGRGFRTSLRYFFWVAHSFAFFAKEWDPNLLAQAQLVDDALVPLGIVGFQVIQQATPLADQHEKAAARAVVFLVRFEVFRQLTNALTQQRDLHFGTSGVGGMYAVLVND